MPDLSNPAVIAVLFGLVVGVSIGLLATRRRAAHVAGRVAAGSWPLKVVAGAALLLGAIPSSLIAFIVGGNLGLTLGSLLLPAAIGEPLGIALGIGIVLSICVTACGAIGIGLGALLASRPRVRGPASQPLATERGDMLELG